MKYAVLEIRYPAILAIPVEDLGALKFSALLTEEGYGRDRKFTVAGSEHKLEMLVVDERDIASYAQPVIEPAPADSIPPVEPPPASNRYF